MGITFPGVSPAALISLGWSITRSAPLRSPHPGRITSGIAHPPWMSGFWRVTPGIASPWSSPYWPWWNAARIALISSSGRNTPWMSLDSWGDTPRVWPVAAPADRGVGDSWGDTPGVRPVVVPAHRGVWPRITRVRTTSPDRWDTATPVVWWSWPWVWPVPPIVRGVGSISLTCIAWWSVTARITWRPTWAFKTQVSLAYVQT